MTFHEVTINEKEIPESYRKDIKDFIKATAKARLARAKINNYNAKHPDKKKDPITKWTHKKLELWYKIKKEMVDYFFPAVGTKVGYLRHTSENCSVECEGIIKKIDGNNVTIKTGNNRLISRTKEEVYHDKAFAWSNVLKTMSMA